MTRVVWVTRAQQEAARWMVARAAATGKPISPAVKLIAEAKPATRDRVAHPSSQAS